MIGNFESRLSLKKVTHRSTSKKMTIRTLSDVMIFRIIKALSFLSLPPSATTKNIKLFA